MKITYDVKKDVINRKKHRISLNDAKQLEWDTPYAIEDNRFDYGETRMVGYAFIDIRLYCVVYSDIGDYRRIISLRKANNREKKSYVYND